MTDNMIRRSQLISPFGVGAMSTMVDGTSVITAGLDHWYQKDNTSYRGEPEAASPEEFEIHDWRLEKRLRVGSFRLPPEYRRPDSRNETPNAGLTVPVLRFPCWHFCRFCKSLKLSKLSNCSHVYCNIHKHTEMSQVPFVAICESGHITDFPFNEWVHKSINPHCSGRELRLISTGGGSLQGQVVVCENCHQKRPLSGITEAHYDNDSHQLHTNLSDLLAEDRQLFLCQGWEPWLGKQENIGCGKPLRGALRAAGNVYFPKVESSIYLPPESGDIHNLLEHTEFIKDLDNTHNLLEDGAIKRNQIPKILKSNIRHLLGSHSSTNYSDSQLMEIFWERFGCAEDEDKPKEARSTKPLMKQLSETLGSSEDWRFPEYKLLREMPDDDLLQCSDPGCPPALSEFIDRVRQVSTLQETRALRGFTRVTDSDLTLEEGKRLLRRTPIRDKQKDWLPAYVVKGEGIYLELSQKRLQQWETTKQVVERAKLINDRFRTATARRHIKQRTITPRFILLHTLSHILINQLVFTCGYSSASLRERLYTSNVEGSEMSGLLIYTASGDSDGTLGGLVRMAEQDRLTDVFLKAINVARWCSTDPVCMDIGEHGQGPDSCNLAACHGCAFVPETSCEEFNRFLDRGLVIGTFENKDIGFFSDFR